MRKKKSKGRTNNGDPGGVKFLFFSMKCERWIAHSCSQGRLINITTVILDPCYAWKQNQV